MMTGRLVILAVLALAAIRCHGASQVSVQIPEAAELQHSDDDVQVQIRELQKNISDVWTYIYDLKNAVSQHLTHLRVHQMELETSVHKMEHLHDGVESHNDDHHQSGEDHSHSSGQLSHEGDPHSHGGDHHSHSGEHHSHSGEYHSHSGEHHSHSGEHHSHGGDHHSRSRDHGHHFDSHSHSSHDHSREDSGHSHSLHGHSREDSGHSHSLHDHSREDSRHSHSLHGHSREDSGHSHSGSYDHHHQDSHEVDELTQQVAPDDAPMAEPITHREHRHDHSHGHDLSSNGRRTSMNLMNEHSFHSHDHHYHSGVRNRTIETPKYADYNLYDFAICEPDNASPGAVRGQVTFWQKKSGGPLNLHVRLRGFSVEDQQVSDNETPVTSGHKHGFHVHAFGDLSDGCQSTGPHYNPKGAHHGAPNALVRHVGDFGNIESDAYGMTNIVFSDDVASLAGQHSIVGRALVIHANQDDLGLSDNAESLKTGNAGARIACCVIRRVDKLAIRHYKGMKTAREYKNF